MKIENPTPETFLRIQIAKEYFDLVSKKMGNWFITAYVFGSTSRNEAKEHSDIDVIFEFKRPSIEKRRLINSQEGGLWSKERQGMICMTYGEEWTRVYMHEMEEKYHIPISPYYFYHDEEGEGFCWLQGNLKMPFEVLKRIGLKYPDDFV